MTPRITHGVYRCTTCGWYTLHKITKKKKYEIHYTCLTCQKQMTRTHT